MTKVRVIDHSAADWQRREALSQQLPDYMREALDQVAEVAGAQASAVINAIQQLRALLRACESAAWDDCDSEGMDTVSAFSGLLKLLPDEKDEGGLLDIVSAVKDAALTTLVEGYQAERRLA